jgi:hypothetical protein
MFKSFLTMPMHSISSNHGIPKPGILLNTLWASSRLSTFGIHVYQAIPHKSYLIHKHFEGFIHEHTCPCQVHLDWHMHGQRVYKINRVWMHTFLLHLLKLFQCRLPLQAFHISQYHGSSTDHIPRWTLSEHRPCSHIEYTCQPSYSLQTHLNPTHFQQWAHECTCPLQVCNYTGTCIHNPHQSHNGWPHTILLQFVEMNPASLCPGAYFTYPNIIAFQMTTSRDGILLNPNWVCCMLPHLEYM